MRGKKHYIQAIQQRLPQYVVREYPEGFVRIWLSDMRVTGATIKLPTDDVSVENFVEEVLKVLGLADGWGDAKPYEMEIIKKLEREFPSVPRGWLLRIMRYAVEARCGNCPLLNQWSW